jgi:heterodisulfide reductase subunit C
LHFNRSHVIQRPVRYTGEELLLESVNRSEIDAETRAEHMHTQLKISLRDSVFSATGQNVSRCYLCGKCSAGCPLISEMDFTPHQVLRLLQPGFEDWDKLALSSKSIWLCLTCETCHTRCPQEVDLPRIMDFLRQQSRRNKLVNPAAKKILAFHQTFLDSVKYTGRLFEIGLIGGYKLRSLNLFQDISIAPKMFLKGKLKIWPHLVKNRSLISRIFKKSYGNQEEKE